MEEISLKEKKEKKIIKIKINNNDYEAFENETILNLLIRNNINVPNFCYDKHLNPFSSCFTCIIKVKNMKGFQPACSTYAVEGMEIITNSDEIFNTRKTNLELLSSNHFADCFGPCKIECPANVDIQTYILLAKLGLFREAIKVIKDSIPLPATIGRVCPSFCEKNCRRNYIDSSVGINNIKRIIADNDIFSDNPYIPEINKESGFKVAIIGSGPAGLSAAYYLRQQGHKIDIFEKMPLPGGMLRYGIPEYRLPKELLDREISQFYKMGINFFFNTEFGKDITIDTLKENGYDAIFIGIGAQSGNFMGIEGEQLDNIRIAVDFLREIATNNFKNNNNYNYKNVVIIGGGNTAFDSARTILRLGAENVTIIYRRTINEMPANKEEIEEAIEEGIKILELSAPIKFIGNKKVEKVELIKMKLGDPDSSGRRSPIPIENSNYIIECDLVIEAISQKIETKYINFLSLNLDGTIKVNSDTFETSIRGIFAGGDVINGPDTVVKALADGKKAAININKYLYGLNKNNNNENYNFVNTTLTPNQNLLNFYISKDVFFKSEKEKNEYFKNYYKNFPTIEKTKPQKIKAEERKLNFIEFNKGINLNDLNIEIERCLQCGCNDINECKLKKYGEEYNVNIKNYLGKYKNENIDSSSYFLLFDKNKCINCGKCIEVCSNILGQNILGFFRRGFETKVQTAFDIPFSETQCIKCGNCINLCPVGALTDKLNNTSVGTFYREYEKNVECYYCSKKCNLRIKYIQDEMIRIKSDDIICKTGKTDIILLNKFYKLLKINFNKKYKIKNINATLLNFDDFISSIEDKKDIEKTIFLFTKYISLSKIEKLFPKIRISFENNNLLFIPFFDQDNKLNYLRKHKIKNNFIDLQIYKNKKITLFSKIKNYGVSTALFLSAPYENIFYLDKKNSYKKFFRYTLIEHIDKLFNIKIKDDLISIFNIDDYKISELKKILKYFKLFNEINIISSFPDYKSKYEISKKSINNLITNNSNKIKNIFYFIDILDIIEINKINLNNINLLNNKNIVISQKTLENLIYQNITKNNFIKNLENIDIILLPFFI
ncbi:MAG: FAD-dependent oxidoreductase [Spirochaetes bacterium]|nr:FAD-dependent oxidoreductase [Spirochaetota bacterium]